MLEVPLAIAAAILFALATVVQQRVASQATDDEATSAGFLFQLAKKPVFLFGIAVDALGFVCQAIALGIGRIAVVQPLLAFSIVFALPLGVRFSGQRIGRRQIYGAAAVTVGLAVFLVVGDPSGGQQDAPLSHWLVAGGVTVGLSAVLFAAALGRSPRTKATCFGLAAGILFGLSAALTKSTVDQLGDGGVVSVFTDWHVYALLAVGWASMTLSQSSLQTGELAPAISSSMAMDPIVSLVLGVVLLDESLTHNPFGLAAAILALAVMVVGIAILAVSEQPPETEGDGAGSGIAPAPAPA